MYNCFPVIRNNQRRKCCKSFLETKWMESEIVPHRADRSWQLIEFLKPVRQNNRWANSLFKVALLVKFPSLIKFTLAFFFPPPLTAYSRLQANLLFYRNLVSPPALTGLIWTPTLKLGLCLMNGLLTSDDQKTPLINHAEDLYYE